MSARGSRGALLAIVGIATISCVTGAQIGGRGDVVREDVAAARKSNAVQCAPRELAIAESNLAFADLELAQGDSFRAEEHMLLAQSNAKQAVLLSKDCGPVQVLIREKPAPVIAPTVALKDTDGDGVPDTIDRCPDVPGPKENFGCPWPDTDGDGVLDKDDKCPNEPGPKENFGCPDKDTDGDGLIDRLDACPLVPGPAENAGCPWADRDGDVVPDKDDKCPDEPGPKENFGCPRKQALIIVRKDRIELKQQVHFATNKSRILHDSDELLREVAQAIKDAPLVKMRVEGHTDNVGKLDDNMKLSQARADSVRDFLIKQGVDAQQLTAEGYGPTRPIASNATKAGKAANRRVEFRMVEKP